MDILAIDEAAGYTDTKVASASRQATTIFAGMVPCARRNTNLGFGYFSDGVATSGMYRRAHTFIFDTADVRLVFANYGGAQGAQVSDGLNAITVKASVEAPVNAPQSALSPIFPVTFRGGASSVTLDPGATVVSDPIPLAAVAGQIMYSHTYVSVASAGMKWPVGDGALVNGNDIDLKEGTRTGAPTTDSTATGSPAPTSTGNMFGPSVVVGTPARGVTRPPTIYGLGDSILYGSNDYTQRWEGWLGRTCEAAGVPVANVGHPGDRAVWGVGNGLRHRMLIAGSCDVMVCNYGANDLLSGGRTLPQFQADTIFIWKQAWLRGLRVYHTTLTPRASSTDNFRTTGNQTPETGNSYSTSRVAFNAWLRDGAPITIATGAAATTGVAAGPTIMRIGNAAHPLAGYIEIADVIETARDSNIWKTGRTVEDAVVTSGTTTVTSVTAAFTADDLHTNVMVWGFGASNAMVERRVVAVNSATSITISGGGASQANTGQRLTIAHFTSDGVHPTMWGHRQIAAARESQISTL